MNQSRRGSFRGRSPQNRSNDQRYSRSHQHQGQPQQQQMSFQEAQRRWDELFKQHLSVRKKFFDSFSQLSHQEKLRQEDQFASATHALRRFEDQLKRHHPEFFRRIMKEYPSEQTYCENHQLDIQGNVEELGLQKSGITLAPHFEILDNTRPSFSEDKEESSGSIEDYVKLKGGISTGSPKQRETRPDRNDPKRTF